MQAKQSKSFNRGGKQQAHKNKRKKEYKVRVENTMPRVTFKLKAHASIATNITGVNLKQINIAPTLSIFPVAVEQAKNFENYRVTRVSYKMLALNNVSY